MLSISLGIIIPILEFLIAIFIIKKAINKEWNSFYRTLTTSLLLRLLFLLTAVALIVLFLKIDLLAFVLTLFVSMFILKMVEIFYIYFNIKFVNLQRTEPK